MSRGRARWIVFASGAGAAGVIVLAVLSWREIAVRYHQVRMERDSARFIAALGGPEGSAEAEAVRRIVAAGRAPLREVFAEFLELLKRCGVDFHEDEDEMILSSNTAAGFDFFGTTGGRGGGLRGPQFANASDDNRLKALLKVLASGRFSIAGVPGQRGAMFRFRVEQEGFPEGLGLWGIGDACCERRMTR